VVNITVCSLFRDVSFVDAGNYTCFAENKFGDAKAEGTLIVKGLCLKVLHGRPVDFLYIKITSLLIWFLHILQLSILRPCSSI
jgi:hypothetical protein